ncbi:MAG: DUF177 domain-containing protein [Candidatus Omnitrophica bacterium]|nr:DUF177 domain-containing protein [Candidatus Omnitrophota bacterium]
MKIVVNEIPRTGLVVEETHSADEIDVERDDIIFREPVTIQAEVRREFDNLHIRVRVNSSIKFNCARCLKPGQRRFACDREIIKPVVEENIIDITQLAREEIILNYPDRLLCKEDCKGLCSRCGWNLNESDCGCGTDDESVFRTHLKL